MLSSVKNMHSIRMPPEFVSHDPVIITSNYMFRFQIMHTTSNDAQSLASGNIPSTLFSFNSEVCLIYCASLARVTVMYNLSSVVSTLGIGSSNLTTVDGTNFLYSSKFSSGTCYKKCMCVLLIINTCTHHFRFFFAMFLAVLVWDVLRCEIFEVTR